MIKADKQYLDSVCGERLRELATEHRLRVIPEAGRAQSVAGDALQPIDMLSNDYLGLGMDSAELDKEFMEEFPDVSYTSSASRLLSRRQTVHNALEDELQRLYGRPSLLFNSGYHANVGVVSALAALPGVRFFCDKAIHASVLDGLAVGRADYKRFPHNDISRLRKILEREATETPQPRRISVIVVESIYSMDGDLAPLRELVELKRVFPDTILYVDEAHALGVRGDRGLGLSEELGLINDIDIIIGTFGKALASAGAFAVTSPEVKSFLINTARPFIFSTALPPVNMARSLFMLRRLRLMTKQRDHLASLSKRLREGVEHITGHAVDSRSQIVPLMIGDAAKAVAVASALREDGFDTLPIRRPTVAAGTERIRLSLNASLSFDDIDRLLGSIRKSLNNNNLPS
mgnify:FL=1